MSELKATPGPWGIERTSTNNWIGPLRTNGKVEEIVVHNSRGIEYSDAYVAIQDANANLIAAAPELHAALSFMISEEYNNANMVLSTGPGGTLEEDAAQEVMDKAWDNVHAALAKARGEQKP